MKNKGHIHVLHTLLAVWLIAVMALVVTACGPKQDPCPVCGATYVCDCAVDTVPLPELTDAPPLQLTRPLYGTGICRELSLAPLGSNGIDTAAGEQMYEQMGIGELRYAELPTEFELKWDESMSVVGITATRYPLFSHQSAEKCELTEDKLTMEAGYYYEFEVIYTTGSATYGITTAAEPAPIPEGATSDVSISYRLLGEDRQAVISSSMVHGVWYYSEQFGWQSMTTEPSPPYRLPGLREIHATEATVTLHKAVDPAVYVISTTPVDEHNEFIYGTDAGKVFSVDANTDNTFELQEGSFYYNVFICSDGRSYTLYGFLAHYDPSMTAVDDPVRELPILTDAPPLRLTRPLYGTDGNEAIEVMYPYEMINSDLPHAPFPFSGGRLDQTESPVTFRIVAEQEIQSIVVRRGLYQNADETMTEWEFVPITDGQILLEAGYCYEFDVVYENGRAIYAIGTPTYPSTTNETRQPDIYLHTGKTTTALFDANYRVTWTEENSEVKVSLPDAPKPSQDLSQVPRITATAPEAFFTKDEGRMVVSYAIAAFPLDENGALRQGGEWVRFTVPENEDSIRESTITGNKFTLLEGSYYYEVYVCLDGSSYDVHSFIADYIPTVG